jgi:hypothetical protein
VAAAACCCSRTVFFVRVILHTRGGVAEARQFGGTPQQRRPLQHKTLFQYCPCPRPADQGLKDQQGIRRLFRGEKPSAGLPSSRGLRPLCRKKMALWSAGPKCGNCNHAADSGRRWDEMEGRYQCAVLAPYESGRFDCRMGFFLRHRGLSPVVVSPCKPQPPAPYIQIHARAKPSSHFPPTPSCSPPPPPRAPLLATSCARRPRSPR